MKIIWLCNMTPGGVSGTGLWIDHVLLGLRNIPGVSLCILCPGGNHPSKREEDGTEYFFFEEGRPQDYAVELENAFADQIRCFQPDLIHIWGTEYGHTLAMVNAARRLGLEQRLAVSIQGLCSVYADHYCDGIPSPIRTKSTLRDILRRDNLAQQQDVFYQRAELERKALEQVTHVIGRTDWDKEHTKQLNPSRTYHFCNETLREPFYQDIWEYDSCCKHRIFVPSRLYPIKGFHYLLEAMPAILAQYPDTTVCVPGNTFFPGSLSDRLRQDGYSRYLQELCEKYQLRDKVCFLGRLDAVQMKQNYLAANVFAMPSAIENSPNSLGEAMLLGVPCVAANVGGTSTMLCPGEGILYPAGDTAALADAIIHVFEQQEQAAVYGIAARKHAARTHNPEENLRTLMEIYTRIATGQ